MVIDQAPTLAWLIAIVLVMAALQFSLLTIEIGNGLIQWYFSPLPWLKKSVAISDVTLAQRVRSKWYYGTGICLTPSGWLYSVWGFDAIALTMTDGSVVMLGSDDVSGLLKSINNQLNS